MIPAIRFTAPIVAAAIALTGCATYSRISSYGGGLVDAKFAFEGRGYTVSVHPVDPTLLISPGFGAAVGRAAASGLTLGVVGEDRPYESWKRAGAAFLAPIGCTVAELHAVDDQFWEVRWSCPAGVDPRALILAQRSALREGAALHP